MTDKPLPALADRWMTTLKNRPTVAVSVIVIALVVGAASFTDAISKLKSFFFSAQQRTPQTLQVTTGAASPNISASGNVNVTYGIPVALLEAWTDRLKSRGTPPDQIIGVLSSLSAQYLALRTELESRGRSIPYYSRVLANVERGDLVRAEAELRAVTNELPDSTHQRLPAPQLGILDQLELLQLRDPPPVSPGRTGSQSSEARPLGRWQLLPGQFGNLSPNAGWIRFDPVIALGEGDCLRIQIGGTAERVLIQYVPHPTFLEAPIGRQMEVGLSPQNRVFEERIEGHGFPVSHIVVHGGPTPWGRSLGANNGPASVQAVTRSPSPC